MKYHSTFNGLTFSLLAITSSIVVGSLSSEAQDGSEYCTNLEDQIGTDQKWKSYNMVLGNCLVRRFIEANQLDDFYALLTDLENIARRNLGSHEIELERLTNTQEGTNRIQSEIKKENAKRAISRRRSDVEDMLEKARLDVAMIEAEIRNSVESCSLIRAADTNACRRESTGKTLARTSDLCERLKAQTALLLAETLKSQMDAE